MARIDLLQAVVRHKSRFFASAWASYDTATPGTFHLVPPDHRHGELAKDLEAMKPIFLASPPSLKELIEQLSGAEAEMNDSLPK
jgi:hypothetical protein